MTTTTTTPTTKPGSDKEKDKDKAQGPRVLVLDDDEGVLKSVSRVLSVKGGCDVLSFSDPKEAQEALANDPTIDVAVLDVMLPQVSGLDILKATKAKRPYMAVVMMTASSSVET